MRLPWQVHQVIAAESGLAWLFARSLCKMIISRQRPGNAPALSAAQLNQKSRSLHDLGHPLNP
jgi:hypothetical protein